MNSIVRFVLIGLGLAIIFAGCEKPGSESASGSPSKKDQTDAVPQSELSDSGHSESHRHGVNGGHIFDFEPATYLGEWVQHRKSDLIQIYILTSDGKRNEPVKADSFIIKRGDTLFSLDPETPDENGASAVYSLDEKDLAIAVNLGVDVEMTIGDQQYSGKILPHDGHHH